jgi:hypothetical protein
MRRQAVQATGASVAVAVGAVVGLGVAWLVLCPGSAHPKTVKLRQRLTPSPAKHR